MRFKYNIKLYITLTVITVVGIGVIFVNSIVKTFSPFKSSKITEIEKSNELKNNFKPDGIQSSPHPGNVAVNTTLFFLKQKYTKETLEYFVEVAFGSEYGSSSQVLRKWEKGQVNIDPKGEMQSQDSACLNSVVTDFNLLSNTTKLIISNISPDIIMHFAPESKFMELESNYVPVNYGFFWKWWDSQNDINSAKILISSAGIKDLERCHLIREELTQSMGLGNDSTKYPESIFYKEWTETQAYSSMDKDLIKILYNEGLTSGTPRSKFVKDVFVKV